MWYINIASRLFGLVTKHACDRQIYRRTDRRTDRQNYDSQDRASIAVSCGKNVWPAPTITCSQSLLLWSWRSTILLSLWHLCTHWILLLYVTNTQDVQIAVIHVVVQPMLNLIQSIKATDIHSLCFHSLRSKCPPLAFTHALNWYCLMAWPACSCYYHIFSLSTHHSHHP